MELRLHWNLGMLAGVMYIIVMMASEIGFPGSWWDSPEYRRTRLSKLFINPQIPNGVIWSESTKETPYCTIIFN